MGRGGRGKAVHKGKKWEGELGNRFTNGMQTRSKGKSTTNIEELESINEKNK